MDEKAKAARRAYQKAWRAANKDRVKTYNAEYWKRKAEQTRQDGESKETEVLNRG